MCDRLSSEPYCLKCTVWARYCIASGYISYLYECVIWDSRGCEMYRDCDLCYCVCNCGLISYLLLFVHWFWWWFLFVDDHPLIFIYDCLLIYTGILFVDDSPMILIYDCLLIYTGDDIMSICYMWYVGNRIKIRIDDCVVIIYYYYFCYCYIFIMTNFIIDIDWLMCNYMLGSDRDISGCGTSSRFLGDWA